MTTNFKEMDGSTFYTNLRFSFKPDNSESILFNLLKRVWDYSPSGTTPLRFSIVHTLPNEFIVESTYISEKISGSDIRLASFPLSKSNCFSVVHVVPTSVGAAIGGFAGDASPATRLLAQVSEAVITHPNVVNASDILSISPNTFYVEGYLLDRFFLGQIGLRPVTSNVLGIVIEKQPQRYIDNVKYSIDAAHAICGVPIVGYAITKEKIGARVRQFESGAYTGIITNPMTLLETAEHLISAGATSIAITSEILDVPDVSKYVQGLEPNPHGGVEALLSRTVARRFNVPTAHAPMYGEFSPQDDPTFPYVDPREAAEIVTTTAIGCVLQGLHKAPQLIECSEARVGDFLVSDIAVIVTPYNSLGNVPVLSSEKLKIPIIGVNENITIQNVSSEHLNLRNYYGVNNYLEAAGFIAALRAGISILSLRRPITNIKPI